MDAFKHRKENKVKIEFIFTVASLQNLPDSVAGKEVSVEIKRGSKIRNYGCTKRILATKSGAILFEDQIIRLSSRFYQDPTTKKLTPEKKEVTINIKEEKSHKSGVMGMLSKVAVAAKAATDKSTILGKTNLNLSLFTDPGSIRHESIPISSSDKKSTFTLNLKVETKWLKLDNKKLVKKTGNSEGGVKIGEEEYSLQTADDISETSASSVSNPSDDNDLDNEDAEEIFQDDDNVTTNNHNITPSPNSNTTTKPSKKLFEKSIESITRVLSPYTKYTSHITSNNVTKLPDIYVSKQKSKENSNGHLSVTEHGCDPLSYIAALTESNVGLSNSQKDHLKHRRNLSDSFISYKEGKMEHVNIGINTKINTMKIRFDKELKNLNSRFEADIKANTKEKDKQVKRLIDEKRKIEETVIKLEDAKNKHEQTAAELLRKLEIELKEKSELQGKVEKLTQKKSKKDSDKYNKEMEDKLQLYEKEITSLHLQLQVTKVEIQRMTNKSNDDIETIGKLNEKVGKLGKTITDQDTVIKDLEDQLDEFREKLRSSMQGQEEAIDEMNKNKNLFIMLQKYYNEQQSKKEIINKTDNNNLELIYEPVIQLQVPIVIVLVIFVFYCMLDSVI